jgi:transcriptional regulator GlxA family with amidase domain
MNPYVVVYPLFPGVTQLDFTAPLEVLSRLPGARSVLASVTGGTLEAGGMTLAELTRLSDVERCDVLCVPGGYGVIEAMEDESYLGELRRLGAGARAVTSVCTGSLLLGAAGFLRGRRAACHWAWRDLLSKFEAVPDVARVARDGRVFTGGGVTAGIDMALTLLAELEGRDFAESVALAIEYAPAPPFDSGRPELARPEIRSVVEERLARFGAPRHAAADRAAKRLLLALDPLPREPAEGTVGMLE